MEMLCSLQIGKNMNTIIACNSAISHRQGLHLHKEKSTTELNENNQDAENLQSLKSAFVHALTENYICEICDLNLFFIFSS